MNDLQSTFLILSASFSSTSCCFSSGNFWDNCKNRCFLAWGFVFALLCSFTKKKTGRVWQYFPAFCHATFHHALITCCNVARAGYIAYCITIGIHLILVNATWPRINQWQSLFSWVKVQEYNNVGCYMLRPFAHPVACCCVLLCTVWNRLATCKRTQQLPTLFFFFLFVF